MGTTQEAGRYGCDHLWRRIHGPRMPERHVSIYIRSEETAGKPTERTTGIGIFSFHVRPSEWVVFYIEHFESQYGEFW